MTVASPGSPRGLMDSTHPQAVLSQLSEQRCQGLFCDVTIVVEDVKFRAHRNVLAATSGYFRNALRNTCAPPEGAWPSSGPVLELRDLRSEVFAGILSFIYGARVMSAGGDDADSLVAAGKRLGIPFLERLTESERKQGSGPASQSQAPAGAALKTTGKPPQPARTLRACATKRETPGPEELQGPRITNAFSITEADLGHNPFTPLDPRGGGGCQSPDLGRLPASCPAPSMPTLENEPAQALSEHSYAVSQGHKAPELDEGGQGLDKRSNRTVQAPPKVPLSSRNFGPLKKRHRLGKPTPSLSDVAGTPAGAPGNCPVLQKAAVIPPVFSLPTLSLDPDAETSPLAPVLVPLAEDAVLSEPEPPSLSPQERPGAATHRCEYCPQAFGNRALLTIHMQIHKKRFVSHLFCKHCRRKFMHLKRLRNHEQVCKYLKGPPTLEPNGKEAGGEPLSDSTPNPGDTTHPLPPPDLHDPFDLHQTLTNPPEAQMTLERVVKVVGSGQRVYNCSVCKRAYVTISSLKRHENVHSWQRAYPCHYCNKVFALAEYRTKHEIWHTGERRYQCIFCLETFMTYYILKNHQKSFHGIDPRLAVKKKSVNGGFKGSVYPIKLYRLLPMKFRKRRYKTYSHTYAEAAEDQSFATPLDGSPPAVHFEGGLATSDPDGICAGQPLFSMPVTFMVTPKMVASEMPRINFDQPCDKNIDLPLPSDTDTSQPRGSRFLQTDAEKDAGLSDLEHNRSSLFEYGYPSPTATMQRGRGLSVIVHGNDVVSPTLKNMDGDRNTNLPFLDVSPAGSFEGVGRLGDLSTIEAMATQLFLPRPENRAPNRAAGGKTETYIAKPACPGPSVDSHVLPLCQITVKIGNEAIIRRKIKGSKLFPKKRKRRRWSQAEHQSGPGSPEATDGVRSPSLRLRTEVTASIVETEQYDDATDRDTDKLWRPYYSYKPKKKKGKKPRSRHKRTRPSRCYTRPLSPDDDGAETVGMETDCSPDESICADGAEVRVRLRRSNSPKTAAAAAYACDVCQGAFPSPAALRAHIAGSHRYFCRTCGKQRPPTGDDANAPISGPRAPSPPPPPAEDGADFVCRSCMEDGSCFGSCFGSDSGAAARGQSAEKRYRCSFCPQRFLYLATKKSHERKHQEKSGHRGGHGCQYCPKVCKSSAHLAVHEKKHFIKTEGEEPDEGMETEGTGSASGVLFSSAAAGEETKPEPWENDDICAPVAPKMEDPTAETDTEGRCREIVRAHKTTTTRLSSPRSDNPFSPAPSEKRHKRKHKKRSILERSKGFGSEEHRHDSMGAETAVQKGPVPNTGTNGHFGSVRPHPTCLTGEPVTLGQTLPVPEQHLCKEEPFFHTHN